MKLEVMGFCRVRGEIIEARAKRRKGDMKLAKLGEIAAGSRLQRERQRNARLDKAHLPTCSATIFMSKVESTAYQEARNWASGSGEHAACVCCQHRQMEYHT